jgi:hypothetical protein
MQHHHYGQMIKMTTHTYKPVLREQALEKGYQMEMLKNKYRKNNLATTMNSITMKEHTKQNMTNDKL